MKIKDRKPVLRSQGRDGYWIVEWTRDDGTRVDFPFCKMGRDSSGFCIDWIYAGRATRNVAGRDESRPYWDMERSVPIEVRAWLFHQLGEMGYIRDYPLYRDRVPTEVIPRPAAYCTPEHDEEPA